MGGKGLSVKFMGVLWHPKNKGVVRFQSRFEVSLDVLYSPPPLQDGSMSLSPPPPHISAQHGDNFLSLIIMKGFHFLQTFPKYYISKKGSFHKLYLLYKTYFFVCSKEPRDCNPSRPWEPDPSVVHSVSVGDETHSALAQPRKGPKGLNYEPL